MSPEVGKRVEASKLEPRSSPDAAREKRSVVGVRTARRLQRRWALIEARVMPARPSYRRVDAVPTRRLRGAIVRSRYGLGNRGDVSGQETSPGPVAGDSARRRPARAFRPTGDRPDRLHRGMVAFLGASSRICVFIKARGLALSACRLALAVVVSTT